MPDALSLSRSELPEEIALAIEELSSAERQEARAMAFATEAEFAKLVEKSEAAYDTLTAAILSRLANGAPASPSGSQASPEAAPHLRPTGVDPSRMQWRPIATAPRDGREILIYCDVTDQMFVAFADGAFWQYAYYTPAKRAIVLGNASHWMPLPPSPAQETEAEGQDAKGGLVHEGSVAEGHAPALTAALARVERLEKALWEIVVRNSEAWPAETRAVRMEEVARTALTELTPASKDD